MAPSCRRRREPWFCPWLALCRQRTQRWFHSLVPSSRQSCEACMPSPPSGKKLELMGSQAGLLNMSVGKGQSPSSRPGCPTLSPTPLPLHHERYHCPASCRSQHYFRKIWGWRLRSGSLTSDELRDPKPMAEWCSGRARGYGPGRAWWRWWQQSPGPAALSQTRCPRTGSAHVTWW